MKTACRHSRKCLQVECLLYYCDKGSSDTSLRVIDIQFVLCFWGGGLSLEWQLITVHWEETDQQHCFWKMSKIIGSLLWLSSTSPVISSDTQQIREHERESAARSVIADFPTTHFRGSEREWSDLEDTSPVLFLSVQTSKTCILVLKPV